MDLSLSDEHLTVAEAAELLKVNRSTIRRWIAEGRLPAVRIGARRLAMRRADVAKLISPVDVRPPEQGMVIHDRLDRSPLTPEERRRGLEAMDVANRLRQEILERRGGEPFTPESWVLLNESRDERSRDLG